ncbi:MAG: hypothetical protein Sylvanvirus1_7 [Sylvanvirus sp.]|uniref:Uncharacterized protein n=1 Tax=Sylvanvirus sp. TaxID=2487774 RepID=A0A3G5AJB1_9VIRU|nr:MAG: hypothetical protein Sylvanvirus1_7 [Sylvanvirus sp.]
MQGNQSFQSKLHHSQPHCIRDLLHSVIQLPITSTDEDRAWAHLLQRHVPQSRIGDSTVIDSIIDNTYNPPKQFNSSTQSVQIVFYWSYQGYPSPVLHFIPRRYELGSVLTAYAYVVSILVPIWILHHTSYQPVMEDLVSYFEKETHALHATTIHKFVAKSKVILQGMQHLRTINRYSTSTLQSIEWESVFYMVNQSHTKHELQQNVVHDPSFQQGLETWEQDCYREAIKKEKSEEDESSET